MPLPSFVSTESAEAVAGCFFRRELSLFTGGGVYVQHSSGLAPSPGTATMLPKDQLECLSRCTCNLLDVGTNIIVEHFKALAESAAIIRCLIRDPLVVHLAPLEFVLRKIMP